MELLDEQLAIAPGDERVLARRSLDKAVTDPDRRRHSSFNSRFLQGLTAVDEAMPLAVGISSRTARRLWSLFRPGCAVKWNHCKIATRDEFWVSIFFRIVAAFSWKRRID